MVSESHLSTFYVSHFEPRVMLNVESFSTESFMVFDMTLYVDSPD